MHSSARGLRQVIRGYLGEVPAISMQKCTMRKVDPDSGSGWHQDGAFLGEVRALNVWLSLSRCGDLAPGLDVISTRLDEIVPTGTEGADRSTGRSHQMWSSGSPPSTEGSCGRSSSPATCCSSTR